MHRSKCRRLFEYSVGAQQERLGNCESYGLSGPEIDDQLEFSRRLYWKIGLPLLPETAPQLQLRGLFS
jgi:hypothetical protein